MDDTFIGETRATLLGEGLDLTVYADVERLGWFAFPHRSGKPCADAQPVSFALVLALLSEERWGWATDRHRALVAAASERFDHAKGMLAARASRGSQAMGYTYAGEIAAALDRLTNELDEVARAVALPGEPLPGGERRELVASGQAAPLLASVDRLR